MKTDQVIGRSPAVDRRRLFLGLPVFAAGIASAHAASAAEPSQATPAGGSPVIVTHHAEGKLTESRFFIARRGLKMPPSYFSSTAFRPRRTCSEI
jgi:hypothetical protein